MIKDNFRFLKEAGIIDENLLKKMQSMAGSEILLSMITVR